MKYLILSLSLVVVLVSCSKKTDPKEWLATEDKRQEELLLITPYVVSMPEDSSREKWFDVAASKKWHKQRAEEMQLTWNAYYVDAKDSTYFYLVNIRDYSSLYERYKLYGGMYTKKQDGSIDSLHALFVSPRLKKEDLKEKGDELFQQIIKERNIGSYYGNQAYIEWPYKGLVYDAAAHQWVMTPENEMYFLQEAKDRVRAENLKLAREMKARRDSL